MPSSTLAKFGYPATLIKTYKYWQLLLRPGQPTLGSLVLVCKESITQYSEISKEAALEHRKVVRQVERVLKHRFAYNKINHLMLMMVDPAVHFHIIPRYDHKVEFCDREYGDTFWPGPAEMGFDLGLDAPYFDELLTTLKADFADHKNLKKQKHAQKKYKRMYTSGCFDIFHQGHLNILKSTKALCDYLVVGVSTDELIAKEKGRPPVIPFEERISVIESNMYVDEVIPQVDKNKQKVVDMYNIDAISVGSDWRGKYPKVSCDLVYFDYTPNVSSTVLKQKLNLVPKKNTD